jgi:hypothetical protein
VFLGCDDNNFNNNNCNNNFNNDNNENINNENNNNINNNINNNNINNNCRFCGILSISQNDGGYYQKFDYDNEYFGILLTKSLNIVLEQAQYYRAIRIDLKYKDYLYSAFVDMVASESLGTLHSMARQWLYRIFGINVFQLFIAENNNDNGGGQLIFFKD